MIFLRWFLISAVVLLVSALGMQDGLSQELLPANAGDNGADQRVLAFVVNKQIWVEQSVSGDVPEGVRVFNHKAGSQTATVQLLSLQEEPFDQWLREDVKLLQKNWSMAKVELDPKTLTLGKHAWRIIEWHVNFFTQIGLDKKSRENSPTSFKRFVHKDPLSKLIVQVTWQYQGNEPDMRDITDFVKGVDGFKWEKALVKESSDRGAEELVQASIEGRLADVIIILDTGVNVDVKFSNETTALLGAAHSGQIDVVKVLVERGADVNIQNSEGSTALIAGAEMSHSNVVKFLIKAGANVNAKMVDGRTALIMASRRGSLETVTILLENGANVEARTLNGATALIAAAYPGHYEIAKILCDHGADVNVKTADGRTALSMAESKGFVELIKLFRKNAQEKD